MNRFDTTAAGPVDLWTAAETRLPTSSQAKTETEADN